MAAFIYVVKCTLCKINANKKVDVKKKTKQNVRLKLTFTYIFYFILIDSSLNVLNNTRLQLKILFMF